jgi:hypothetical protein
MCTVLSTLMKSHFVPLSQKWDRNHPPKYTHCICYLLVSHLIAVLVIRTTSGYHNACICQHYTRFQASSGILEWLRSGGGGKQGMTLLPIGSVCRWHNDVPSSYGK